MRKLASIGGLLGALGLLLLSLTGPTQAATPSSGAISSASPSVSWSGGPFATPRGTSGCLAQAAAQICDVFRLTVNAPRDEVVEVYAAADSVTDDIGLHVYLDDLPMGSSSSASHEEQVRFPHVGGTRTYEVRVEPSIFLPSGTYQAIARILGNEPIDSPQDCGQFIPDVRSVPDVTYNDDGRRINLDVALLVDRRTSPGGWRITESIARAIADTAKTSYSPLGIDIRVSSYAETTLSGNEVVTLFDQTKAFFGGRRPADADIVYMMTPVDIQSDGDSGVAGVADCIGGVQWATTAFTIGEVVELESFGIAGFRFYKNLNAKVLAHEAGHLLGAHHHYANCAQPIARLALEREVGPCTLMAPLADFLTLDFGAVEGAVVRGKAYRWAQP